MAGVTNEEFFCPDGHYRYRIGSVEPDLVDDKPSKLTGNELTCPICGQQLVQGKYTEKREDAWTTGGG